MGKIREPRGALFLAEKGWERAPGLLYVPRFNGSPLLAGVVGGGIGGSQVCQEGSCRPLGFFRGPSVSVGEMYTWCPAGSCHRSIWRPGNSGGCSQRAGLAQAVVLLHLQVEIVVGPVGNGVEQVTALNLGAPLGQVSPTIFSQR